MCGKLHWRKNDSNWKECYAKIKTGDLVISGKEVELDLFSILSYLVNVSIYECIRIM